MGSGNSKDGLNQINFSSYNSACLLHPDLKSFDSNLCDLTKLTINNVADGVKDGSPSLDSLIAVNNCFSKVTTGVVEVILHEKKNIRKNKQLSALVENFFQLSFETLDLCTAIEECLNRAQNSQCNIKLAVKTFDEENQGNVGVRGSEKDLYSETLKRLEEFKNNDEIFTPDLYEKLESLIKAQNSMLESLQKTKNELDKKKLITWKRVCMTIFGGTNSLMAVSKLMLLTLILGPLCLIQLSGATFEELESMVRWLKQIWGKSEKDLITSMQNKTSITINELKFIRNDVKTLKTKMKDLLASADMATVQHNAQAVKIAIDAIRKKLDGFEVAIQNLDERNEECRRHTRKAMSEVLDMIKKY